MRSAAKSLDGAQGDVHDETGTRVATFALDDRREKAGDPVYAVFEDREPAWEDRLVADEQPSSLDAVYFGIDHPDLWPGRSRPVSPRPSSPAR